MKLLPRIVALKVIATVLFILAAACTMAFGFGFAYAVNGGYFDYPQAEGYLSSAQLAEAMKGSLENVSTDGTASDNLVYGIISDGVTTLLSPDDVPTVKETHTELTVDENTVYFAELKESLTERDAFYYDSRLYDFVYSARYSFCIVTVSCLAVSLFFGYFIMCGAGRKRKSEKVYLNMADRLPLDLYALGVFAAVALAAAVSLRLIQKLALWTLFVIIPCLLLISALIAALMNTTAKRVKNGTWWNGMILSRACSIARRVILQVIKDVEKLFVGLPIVWRVLMTALAYLAITIIAINIKNGIITVIWLAGSVGLIIAICLTVLSADKLKQGADRLAQGNLDFKIDTDGMLPIFKKHADNLNSIGDVLTKAVDERTRSEKFKAELITNVSHDIKTPITSIINYVDLLGRGKLTDEQLKEYLDVLKRQSERLRKLTVDLVEASKASTGNITVNYEAIDICEMLKQTTGEFSERIASAGLKLELEFPDMPMVVSADGRLLWRVFENLLTNICKYSLPGTRVYVTAVLRDGMAVADFKNISRARLYAVGQELTERFVRGDSARSTDGSGLGLSIAKSFTELQNGIFNITVDGDLFKAEVKFPLKSDGA